MFSLQTAAFFVALLTIPTTVDAESARGTYALIVDLLSAPELATKASACL